MVGVQRYVSSELTHFVGRKFIPNENAQFDLLVSILKSGLLTSDPGKKMGWSITISFEHSVSTNLMVTPYAVCFCDIPLEDLSIHIAKYGRFGLAFEKSFLTSKGANPVWYIAKNSVTEHRAALPNPKATKPYPRKQMPRSTYYDLAAGRFQGFGPDNLTADEATDLADFRAFFEAEVLAFMKFFDHTMSDEDAENYYMEREWRVVGQATFELKDVSRIILPREFSGRLRDELPDYSGQVSFAPAT